MADSEAKLEGEAGSKVVDMEDKGSEDANDEKKIETAIKFLQNPNVRKTSFDNRVAFLKKKGLSQREIDIAIERSGAQEDKNVNYKQDHQLQKKDHGMPSAPSQAVMMQLQPRSFGSQVSSVVIGGGIIYATIHIFKNYVIPYFTGGEQDEMKSLDKNIKELNKGISELSLVMQNTIKTLEAKLEEQQDMLTKVNAELEITKKKLDVIPSDVTSLSDVRAEISSVKGLLLGRHQFPTTPFSSTTTSPSIPAWQKASAKKKQIEMKQFEDVKDDAKDVNAEARDKKDSIILDECVECSEVNEDGDSILFNDSIDREVAELTENNSNSFSSTYIKVNKEC